MNSAPFHRLAEDVIILPVVIPELEFRDVQGKVFTAHLVIGADNAALQNRPEALNRVGVDRADNVLPGTLVDGSILGSER
jgi:hypothetical protein